KPVKLAVTVAVKNGIASFDFSNSDPQARGPVNLRPSMVEACVFYSLIGCLGPNLHFNDGMRDEVRLTYAPPTNNNTEPPPAPSPKRPISSGWTPFVRRSPILTPRAQTQMPAHRAR